MAATNFKLRSDMAANYAAGTWRMILLSDARSVFGFTADTGTNLLTTSVPHDFLLNTPVILSVTGGTLPSPFIPGQIYYARDIGASELGLATTPGGAIIDITSLGSGTFSVTDIAAELADAALDAFSLATVAQWVRKEIPSYEGAANRGAWVPSAPTTANGITTVPGSAVFDNSTGTNPIVFDSYLTIQGGSATQGNTTGTTAQYGKYGSAQVIPAGSSYTQSAPISIFNQS
jgi:hypothetical protein